MSAPRSVLADRVYRYWLVRNGSPQSERERWVADALSLGQRGKPAGAEGPRLRGGVAPMRAQEAKAGDRGGTPQVLGRRAGGAHA